MSTAAPVNLTSGADGACASWLGAQHFLFQLASLGLAISFLVPSYIKLHLFLLRGVLCVGCLLLILWAGLIVNQPDVLGWYLVLLIINLVHIVYMLYRIYPVRFPHKYAGLYEVFKPFAVTRLQFRELAEQGEMKQLKCGAIYAQEGTTVVGDQVAVVISGRMRVQCRNMTLHDIDKNQFVDSTEFHTCTDAVAPSNEKYQVSVTALDDTSLLVWQAVTLRQVLAAQPFMQAVFAHVLGRDITNKLYQVQERVLAHPHPGERVADKKPAYDRQNSVVTFRHQMSQQISTEPGMDTIYMGRSWESIDTFDEFSESRI